MQIQSCCKKGNSKNTMGMSIDSNTYVAGYYPYPGGDLELDDNEEDSKDKRETSHEPDDIKCPRYGSVSA